MEILLEEFYKTDLHTDRFHDRKVFLEAKSYQINGITQSGKTQLVKNYLLSLRKNTYLYIDCADVRIDIDEINSYMPKFCKEHKIDVLVLDNYMPKFEFANVSQLIICCEEHYDYEYLETITLYPLDYEEFLAYEHKYDSTALNHFLKLGSLPVMHKIHQDERNRYIQKTLKLALSEIEFDLLTLCARLMAQKVSAFSLYERLKQTRKISKDKLYVSFDTLHAKNYIHQVAKIDHPKAVKKMYLCDIAYKAALSVEKHFGRLFENMIYLELLKSNRLCFYHDDIEFYIPKADEIILAMPFGDERAVFKRLERIEAFIFSYQVRRITAITMNNEGKVSHPFSKVEIVPFDIWALRD